VTTTPAFALAAGLQLFATQRDFARCLGGQLWQDLADRPQGLATAGFTAIWIPPAYKGSGGQHDVGYSVYDLFDLGEFDQKGGLATKYGTRAQLEVALEALRAVGLQVYADVVFNHKNGADGVEDVWAQQVDWQDRNRALSDWYQIKAWTYFDFPGRAGQYSTMKWYWWCFDAVSYDHNHPERGSTHLFRLRDKQFCTEVSHETATTTTCWPPTWTWASSSSGASWLTGAIGSCRRPGWMACASMPASTSVGRSFPGGWASGGASAAGPLRRRGVLERRRGGAAPLPRRHRVFGGRSWLTVARHRPTPCPSVRRMFVRLGSRGESAPLEPTNQRRRSDERFTSG
jgi:hypothetical protein